jgi:hypothetical protein
MSRTASLPGDTEPGRLQPGMSHPGARTPGEQVEDTYDLTGIDLTVATTHDMGDVDGDRVTAVEFETDVGVTTFDFQVRLNGVDLFDSAQSPSTTGPETFAVDNSAAAVVGDETVSAEFEITSAAGSDSNQDDFTLTVVTEEE